MGWSLSNPTAVIAVCSVLMLVLTATVYLISTGRWVRGVNDLRKDFNEFKCSINEKIESILSQLGGDPLILPGSPLALTKSGQAISTEIDAAPWAQETAARVAFLVSGKTEYEIQEFSFSYVKNDTNLGPALLKKIQECAYERGLTVDAVKKVPAVELRDALIKRSRAAPEGSL